MMYDLSMVHALRCQLVPLWKDRRRIQGRISPNPFSTNPRFAPTWVCGSHHSCLKLYSFLYVIFSYIILLRTICPLSPLCSHYYFFNILMPSPRRMLNHLPCKSNHFIFFILCFSPFRHLFLSFLSFLSILFCPFFFFLFKHLASSISFNYNTLDYIYNVHNLILTHQIILQVDKLPHLIQILNLTHFHSKESTN